MDLNPSILGRSTVAYIAERQTRAVLMIGADAFDRASLARVACFNFVAATNLSKALNGELHVRDTRDVFENIHPDRVALPRLGPVALAVLGAAFEVKKLGGSAPLESWFNKHRDQGVVTFAAIKNSARRQERASSAKTGRARRRAARR